MITEHQIEIIKALKDYKKADIDKSIPIISDKKIVIGSLKPLDNNLSQNESIISSLTAWRQMNMVYFFSQFKATNERTKTWINNVVIKDNTKVIFLIMTETNKMIGHIGICHISEDSVEIDNLMRGESGGDHKLMLFSEISLIYWVYKTLNIKNIYLHAFSNNVRTIMLHESVGFICTNTYGLTKKENYGEISYAIDYLSKPDKDNFGITRMAIDKHDFFSKHSWLEG